MYQQPNGYQQGLSHGAGYGGPPPAKKAKSNPVITRYPPPPGYKGPAQPQPPHQGYGWGQAGYGGHTPQPYSAPPYGAPSTYQQPQWPTHQQQPYVTPDYPPAQGYNQSQHPYSFPAYGWQQPLQSAPPQPWQPPHTAAPQSNRRHNSAPFSHARRAPSGPLDGNGDPLPAQSTPTSGADALEEDFDGECYFARHPDEIDPNFSLGLIEWHAPLPTKLALPATYAEAELEALAPRKPRAAGEESISDYFTNETRDESLLSIRQTAAWDEVKHDVIYRELPAVSDQLLNMSEMLVMYRDRPDPRWTKPLSTTKQSRQGTPVKVEQGEDGMDVDSYDRSHAQVKREASLEQNDVLGNLEQALFANDTQSYTNGHSTAGGAHSRTASISSTTGEEITRPRPLAPIRDLMQEDVLASLGVTGSPKMVYQTPGPAFGTAPPPQQGSFASTHSRQNSVNSYTGNGIATKGQQWPQQHQTNGHALYRPTSAGSQHTAAGSDFDAADLDATPRPPKHGRTDTRKRSHGEFENGGPEIALSRATDDTPRQRYKHARVDRAYE